MSEETVLSKNPADFSFAVGDDDNLPAEFTSRTPSDWLFLTMVDGEWTNIAVVPKSFWEKNYYLYDQHFDLDWTGLSYLMEPPAAESNWMTDTDEATVIAEMTAMGFIHRPHLFDDLALGSFEGDDD